MRIRSRLLAVCIPLVVAPVFLLGYLNFLHTQAITKDADALSRDITSLQDTTDRTANEVLSLLERRSRSDYAFFSLQIQSGILLTMTSLTRLVETLSASTLVASFMNASPQARPVAVRQVEVLFAEALRNYALSELTLVDAEGRELLRMTQDVPLPGGDAFDAVPMNNQTEDESAEAWFRARLNDHSGIVSSLVYLDRDFPFAPEPVLCLSAALIYSGERYNPYRGLRLGFLKLTIPLREILGAAMPRNTDVPATIVLTDAQDSILAHPDPGDVGKAFTAVYPDTDSFFVSSRVVMSGQVTLRVLAPKAELRRNVEFVNRLSNSLQTQASFARTVAETMQKSLRVQRRQAVLVALITLGVAVTLVVLMARKLSAPLADLALTARRIARGDLADTAAIPAGLPLEMERLWRHLELMRANLKDHIDNLDRKVAERTLELSESNRQLVVAKDEVERAYGKLKDIDALKTEFLSTVSHELRTPLTSISGFAVMIQARLSENVLPHLAPEHATMERTLRRVARDVGIIIVEADRLTTLIEDLLDIARLESGKAIWKDEPLRVDELVKRAVESISSLFDSKGLRLETDIESGLPVIVADRARIIQVLINLLGNAHKFTNEGTVTCTARRQGANIAISVRDTGPGIAPEDQENIFDRFRQVDNSETGKPAGTGLGLAICREIVMHYGGSLWVESEPGHGSLFIFALPFAPDASTGEPPISV